MEPHGWDSAFILTPFLPCEDTVRNQQPDTEEALTRSRPRGLLDLRLPAPRAMSNMLLCSTSHLVCGTLSEPELTKKDCENEGA